MVEVFRRLGSEFCEVRIIGALYGVCKSGLIAAHIVEETLYCFDGELADSVEGWTIGAWLLRG